MQVVLNISTSVEKQRGPLRGMADSIYHHSNLKAILKSRQEDDDAKPAGFNPKEAQSDTFSTEMLPPFPCLYRRVRKYKGC